MLDRDSLQDLLHRDGQTRLDNLLLCLAVDAGTPKTVKLLRETARSAGLRAAEKWNISAVLAASGGRAVRAHGGWLLNNAGRTRVEELLGAQTRPTSSASRELRKHLAKITNPDVRALAEEAVQCLEYKLYRAAVVLAWVGAVAVLYDQVVNHHLLDFNAEASRRDPRWKAARNVDDLAEMKEFAFLQILDSISVIGKNVRRELEGCLALRNGCGHPNSLKIGENRVASHIETLVQNVFSVF